MSGLELEYRSIQECINEVQKLPAIYPAAERPSLRGEGRDITELEQTVDTYVFFYEAAEALIESTAKYLDCVIKGFKEADYKNIEIS